MFVRRLLVFLVLSVVLAIVVFSAVLLGRARWMPSHQLAHVEDSVKQFKPGKMVSRFQSALRLKTTVGNTAEFRRYRAFLKRSYPRMHRALKLERVSENTLLYRWKGSNSEARPILWLANYDVVGVDERMTKWQHPPFAGHIDEDYLWGRGALDGKVLSLIMAESIEQLLRDGFKPSRTLYLAFTHDSETGSKAGAAELAKLLAKRDVRLEYALAPGGAIGEKIVPDTQAPVALIGVAEKGFLSLRLSVEQQGGPSSLPGRQSSISMLGQAVKRLEDSPFPARLTPTLRRMHDYVAESMPVSDRVGLANMWLFEPLVLRRLADDQATSSQVRTTTAVTMVRSGTEDTMLARSAEAVVNFRMIQGDSKADVIRRVQQVVADPRVTVEEYGDVFAEPSVPSSIQAPAFYALQRAFRQTYKQAITSPFLLSGISDGRFFTDVADNVYRATPLHMNAEDMRRIHGANERVRLADLPLAADFYMRLVRASN